jgi:arabinofuranosyltransferase
VSGLKRLDVLIAGLLLLFSSVFGFLFVNFAIPPFEDAAMLMRYAGHLADGHGIVWNVGEPPVDGATDFLFMALVAGVRLTGASLEAAVRILTIGCHLANIAVIYFGLRSVQSAGRFAAVISAACFALGPGFHLAAAYFGTPCFALALSVSWLLAQSILLNGRTDRLAYFGFSLSALIAGLIRPEGVIYGVLFLAAILTVKRGKDAFALAATFAAVMFGLGGVYFLWRWSYFGHPLPNPFYRKGGGHFYPLSLWAAAQENFRLALPFLGAVALALREPRTRRLALAFAIPFVGSTLMWGLLSDEMNFGGRFQYPTLALACLSWFPLARGAFEARGRSAVPRAALAALAGLYALVAIGYGAMQADAITYGEDGRFVVAKRLAHYPGHSLATTEAGLLPLYSGWKALDAWGLNDPWIAHNGGLTAAYLAAQRPDLIVIHASLEAGTSYGAGWDRMTRTLTDYAKSQGFALAAAFCVAPSSAHFYYVRQGMPDSAAIIEDIRSVDYRWHTTGVEARNCAAP